MFTANIDSKSMSLLFQYLVDLQRKGARELIIAISSQGGNVASGITMYNAIRAATINVTTHNIGNIDSIATAVFLAGQQRVANESATFMFHGVGIGLTGNQRLEERDLLEKLDVVAAEHRRLSKLIASHSSLAIDQCMDLFKQQKTRDADWAQTKGLVHEVKDFVIPADVDVRYLG
ncbi:ATP-dependent Clp protease proteolytic subunit [Bradyrhizobium sp.]|uniref:ATP-dependent Clp protease proteolytic subunit n=1 Tax=Bradyrhizobium sp. TaxID=376 RepID=UPI0039E674AB